MNGSGPMDAFVVDHVTAAAIKDAKAHIKELLEEKMERTTFTVEDVKLITDRTCEAGSRSCHGRTR